MVTAERLRLDEADSGGVPWRRWGPYLSERQWGTVREDYGGGDDTWSYFSHEQARSRAYRGGEDGLVAIATLPGATLWHEGQFEGRRVRPPVFLSSRPDEAPDLELAAWYRCLLASPGLFVDLGPRQFHLLALR
jgi:hypothetical protein